MNIPHSRRTSEDERQARAPRAATRYGDDPGVVVPVGRGGIVAMSSALFHRSGPNTTPQPRRAFLNSYSAQPILNPQGGEWNRAVPFLRDGERVRG